MTTNRDDYEDSDVLTKLSGTYAGQTMTTGLDDVLARGRRTRNRHRALATGIGASAAALVAAIGMLAPSGTGVAPAVAAGPQGAKTVTTHTGVDIENAGFSVRSNQDHTVSVTVKEIFDAAALRSALAEAGVPADVQTPAAPPQDGNAYECQVPAGVRFLDSRGALDFRGGKPTVFTVDPAKMPAGSVVVLYVYDVFSATGDGAKAGRATGVSLMSADPGPCVWVLSPKNGDMAKH